MNKECNNHAFGCSGNCKFETVAFNKNGDCLQFEPQHKEIEKINASEYKGWALEPFIRKIIELKLNELIDAVNEARRKE